MVVITKTEGRLTLRAPFHPDLSFHARALRGRWRGEDTGWVFAPEQEEALRARCLSLWGVDGCPEAFADLVMVEITVAETDVRSPLWRQFGDGIWLAGREIVSVVKGRGPARPGRGVRFLKGGPLLETRGLERWTVVQNGAIVLVDEVPRMALPHFERGLAGHGQLRLPAT